ncbi:hypothetical protein [Streptomyces sp. TN58]|uniref:hypothetical protein n=1 Tax=Streptomyces sp. TN58 TaxID=234612 RepID=UPI0009507B37|nr:hypothetical protein [Streptomyces sp. TN58]APU43068.1 hypothetical protein BSL84_28105 [Streptomyces sp. TN58]
MRDHNLAGAVTVVLSVLFGLLLLLALAFGMLGGKSSALTEADVIGIWHGDRGARLEVLADGRARLSDASAWKCSRGDKPGVFTGEGSWTLGHLTDENPGILLTFSPDGTPAVQSCSDWFLLDGTGKEGTTGDGSDVTATFRGYKRAAEELYRRTPTG